jgi:hypothetical protein
VKRALLALLAWLGPGVLSPVVLIAGWAILLAGPLFAARAAWRRWPG